jgi:hypothetical protein
MPIDNAFLLINNSAIRPAPSITMEYEKFMSGEYLIGGILKINLEGQIIGNNLNDLNNKIKNIVNYSGKCQTIKISCGATKLVDGIGFVGAVNVTPSDQPFMVNYTATIDVGINNGKKVIVPDERFLSLYDVNIPDNLILASYDESLSLSGDESLSNTGFYGQSFTKASLKFSGSISIQAHNHMCSNNTNSILDQLYSILNSRANRLLSLDSTLIDSYPLLQNYCNGSWEAIHDTKSLSINKLDHKIEWKFDLFIISGECHPKGIVSVNITESTDQTTGLSTFSAKGSIKGLNNRTSSVIDHNIMNNDKINNARQIYDDMAATGPYIGGAYGYEIFGCFTAANLPPNTCYQRTSSQSTQSTNNGQIEFDFTYSDVESCQLGGNNIEISIDEEYPTQKYIEHIIPGRGSALVQISNSVSAYKVNITASGKLNSCDTTQMNNLVSCVYGQFLQTINSRGFNQYLLIKEDITLGKYSYKITRSYIGC